MFKDLNTLYPATFVGPIKKLRSRSMSRWPVLAGVSFPAQVIVSRLSNELRLLTVLLSVAKLTRV